MPTPTQPLLRFTVSKTVHLVTTLEVYSAPTPPRPVIVTTGVEVTSELPPSQPGLRAARPSNVIALPARRIAGGR